MENGNVVYITYVIDNKVNSEEIVEISIVKEFLIFFLMN